MKVTNEKTQEFTLTEAFVLWKQTAKSGKEYLKGHTTGKTAKLVGFINSMKENPKEPDVRIYSLDVEGKQDIEVASLWETVSVKGNRYLTGSTNEKEKLVAWYSKDDNEARPYIRAYFKQN